MIILTPKTHLFTQIKTWTQQKEWGVIWGCER